jgi:hypothetical protein
MTAPDELTRALLLADRVLDRPGADPDDDLAVLARQLMRTCESIVAMRPHLRVLPATFDSWMGRVGRAVEARDAARVARGDAEDV